MANLVKFRFIIQKYFFLHLPCLKLLILMYKISGVGMVETEERMCVSDRLMLTGRGGGDQ